MDTCYDVGEPAGHAARERSQPQKDGRCTLSLPGGVSRSHTQRDREHNSGARGRGDQGEEESSPQDKFCRRRRKAVEWTMGIVAPVHLMLRTGRLKMVNRVTFSYFTS